jgi:hypothetical protein
VSAAREEVYPFGRCSAGDNRMSGLKKVDFKKLLKMQT